MKPVKYEIVEHDGGYAYRVGDVFSDTYATHEAALEAAEAAAHRQEREDVDRDILYEDSEGTWHAEFARGDDRPATEISDKGVESGSHVRRVQSGLPREDE